MVLFIVNLKPNMRHSSFLHVSVLMHWLRDYNIHCIQFVQKSFFSAVKCNDLPGAASAAAPEDT
jgi:hypothetical protein